jgi:hypothetical protein
MDGNPHAPRAGQFDPPVVYRALPYDNLIKRDGSHKDNVFHRHPRRDPNGLSVTTTIRECKALFERPIFGVRRVNVGALREYGLELFPTSATHANIRFRNGENIPVLAENPNLARDIAGDLMRMSDPIPHWDAQNADELEQALLNPN